MKLSAIIITKNEEEAISRCIKSVSFADEVVVVDAESTDKTVALARALGARVFIKKWEGYGAQKNFGAKEAHGDWLLFIDADEEVTPNLAQEIERALVAPKADFYWLRIITVFLTTPLRHMYGHNLRLFRATQGKWGEGEVHEQVETATGTKITLGDTHSALLTQELWHFSHRSITSYLETMHAYTTLEAKESARTGRHRSGRLLSRRWWTPWYMAVRQFLKLFFYKKGWLDGRAGIIWCVLSAYYEWEMANKFNRLGTV